MSLLFCIFAAGLSVASESQMGTWKLNEAKSKLDPKLGKNHTVLYAPEGDQVKIVVDGVEANGKPRHNEWVGKFDGKDYPVIGDPTTDARAYTVVDDHTLSMTNKKDGKDTLKGTVVLSPDGKMRTLHLTGKDSKGNPIDSTAVYDKQ